jgi:uroporphyrinogen III methyltransferase/synthase
MPEDAPARAAAVFARKPDWITFTSSSTVGNFVAAAGAAALEGVKVASIGPITSKTARSLGIEVTVEAASFTIDGLVDAILRGR